VRACIAELDAVSERRLAEYVELATEAAASLRDGRWRASLALSANLMDTILKQPFDKALEEEAHRPKPGISWEDYPIRSALVIAGVWARTESPGRARVTPSLVGTHGMRQRTASLVVSTQG
jgi:hypothetical protein